VCLSTPATPTPELVGRLAQAPVQALLLQTYAHIIHVLSFVAHFALRGRVRGVNPALHSALAADKGVCYDCGGNVL
jgi:hypothetical protein